MADFSIAALIKAIDGVTAPVGKISRSFGALGNAAKKVGQKMTVGITLPAVAAGGMMLRTTIGFQEAMNKVAAVMDPPADKLREMEMLARKMGAATQFSATDAANAMTFLAMAGLTTEQAMAALPGTLELAAAGGLDMATAADLATNVLAGMRMEVGQLGRVNDVLAKGASSANTNVQELAEALKTAGPISAATNVSLEETVAVLGILANAGFKGEEAGTALRNAIARLVDPAPEAQKALVKLGITSRDVVDEGGKIVNFTALLNKMRAGGATAADMMAIFGLRAGPQLLAALGQGEGAVEGLRGKLESAQGSAKRMAEAMMRGLPGSIKELESAFEELQLAIADSGVAAAITDIILSVTDFIRRLGEASPATLKFVTAIIGIAAVLGPIIAALGFLAIGIGALATPFGLAVVAITAGTAAIGALAYGIYAAWEPVADFFAGLWDTITAKFEAGWNVIKGIVAAVKVAVQSITSPLEMLSRARNAVGGFFGNLFGGDEGATGAATGNAIPGAVQAAAAGARGRDAQARVEVVFPNAPGGTRVTGDVDGDGLDLGVETGMQFGGAF